MNNLIFNKSSKLIAVSIFLLIAILTSILFISVDSVNVADAASDPIVDGGVYAIQNKATGYYLDVSGEGTGNNTDIIAYSENMNLNQRFILRKVSATEWEMFPMHIASSTHLIVVHNASSSNGETIILYQDNGTPNQKFKFVSNNDGSYKIKTQSSGYNLAIGMQNNSYEIGAKCVQSTASNSTTNWYFKQIWNFSDKGKKYSKSEPLPTPRTHPIYGTPTLVKEQKFTKEVPEYQAYWITVGKKTIDDYHIKYWRYSVPVNTVYHNFTPYLQVNPNSVNRVTFSTAKSQTKSYQESITAGLSYSLTSTLGTQIKAANLQLSNSLSSGVNANISATMQYSTQYTYTLDAEVVLELDTRNLDKNKIYTSRAEARGNMYLYFIQVYKYNYNVIMASSGSTRGYVYEFLNKSVDEELFQWEFDKDTITLGNYAYEENPQTHKYTYCGYKYDGIIYC